MALIIKQDSVYRLYIMRKAVHHVMAVHQVRCSFRRRLSPPHFFSWFLKRGVSFSCGCRWMCRQCLAFEFPLICSQMSQLTFYHNLSCVFQIKHLEFHYYFCHIRGFCIIILQQTLELSFPFNIIIFMYCIFAIGR